MILMELDKKCHKMLSMFLPPEDESGTLAGTIFRTLGQTCKRYGLQLSFDPIQANNHGLSI